ncbi:DNA mismatch endonuclease Vsr [Mesorhizobium sp. M1E.F.Ca.ET.045.02.1.1]|uniref:very short patch repair endonuclease n=1 Tax=Mesorhizobium sp. M1E.F.Ca.ET.045.02.1.1 TaxID=2493672 RepID=UPI000F75E437|nr:very short patch repair endonuclease [Mesorhizobium sp. M1E.F.Ca.ET.045.02.1.1]AZO21575.1 DNA mismatch endonuclease Vsr [Mesorhizobium sp. M1E.F.Ca.ET.045.02.1.1]
MVDRLRGEQRSRIMARVGQKNTAPELFVRHALHAAGLRFRLHRRDLPGSPDLVLPKHRMVVLVHGCFWHGHNCPRGRRPRSNVEFWTPKLKRNMERDQVVRTKLEALGWRVVIVWECALEEGVQLVLSQLHVSAGAIEPER